HALGQQLIKLLARPLRRRYSCGHGDASSCRRRQPATLGVSVPSKSASPSRYPATLGLHLVARDHQHRYHFFRRAFDSNATVQVILDRRVANRRQRATFRARERRQRNRRSPQTIDGTLRTEGWTIIRLRPPRNRRDST